MFRGIFHNSLDDKGRMSLPARFREQIKTDHETPLVLTLGLDQCLWLYPMDHWKSIEEKLSGMDTLNNDQRWLQRFFMRASDEVELDQQGRIVISPVLRKEAGLNKNIVIVGMLKRIEIWDKEKYEGYNSQTAASLELLAQKVSEKGLPPLPL